MTESNLPVVHRIIICIVCLLLLKRLLRSYAQTIPLIVPLPLASWVLQCRSMPWPPQIEHGICFFVMIWTNQAASLQQLPSYPLRPLVVHSTGHSLDQPYQQGLHLADFSLLVGRPNDVGITESFPRDDILAIPKFLAEAKPSEKKTILGWLVDTRRFIVALPKDKHAMWSRSIDKIFNSCDVIVTAKLLDVWCQDFLTKMLHQIFYTPIKIENYYGSRYKQVAQDQAFSSWSGVYKWCLYEGLYTCSGSWLKPKEQAKQSEAPRCCSDREGHN